MLSLHLLKDKENSVGHRSINIALKISTCLEKDRNSSKAISERLVNVFMDLLTDALTTETWTPNEFTTYLLMSIGVFKVSYFGIVMVLISPFPLNAMAELNRNIALN